ncbi:MAG: hypothetical protein ACJATI_002545 [Halioglobus sp.]|jgi:hypothetical protein
MNNGEEPAYQYLSNLMKSDNFLQYSDFLKYMMVAYSIIYLTRQTSKYSPQRTPELLELYQFAVDSNTIGLNKFLNLQKYLNVITVACKSKELNWAIEFATEYASKVSKSNEYSIAQIGHANIDFF